MQVQGGVQGHTNGVANPAMVAITQDRYRASPATHELVELIASSNCLPSIRVCNGDSTTGISTVPWGAIIEPYKQSIVEAVFDCTSYSLNLSSTSVTFAWNIEGGLQYGRKVYFKATKVGWHHFNLTLSHNGKV